MDKDLKTEGDGPEKEAVAEIEYVELTSPLGFITETRWAKSVSSWAQDQRLRDIAVWSAVILAIGLTPILLQDTFSKVSTDNGEAHIAWDPKAPGQAALPQSGVSQQDVIQTLARAGDSTSDLSRSDRLRLLFGRLQNTPEGVILLEAMQRYAALDEIAPEEITSAFERERLDDVTDEELVRSAYRSFDYLLQRRDLYMSMLPADLVPTLIERELGFYREYASVDAVSCGAMPALSDPSLMEFPTVSLRVGANELQKLKSVESGFALDQPVLRQEAAQFHRDAILERASASRSEVAETVWDIEDLSYEEGLAYQCRLAIHALDYLHEMDGAQQVALYESLFGTFFGDVERYTHFDDLLPEQVMFFSSVAYDPE